MEFLEMFLNDSQLHNRYVIKAMPGNYSANDSMVIGYIYETNGQYRTYYLSNSLDNIARFILHDTKDKMICNTMDYGLVSTIGDMIDICPDEQFLQHLLDAMKTAPKRVAFEHYN